MAIIALNAILSGDKGFGKILHIARQAKILVSGRAKHQQRRERRTEGSAKCLNGAI